MLFVVIFLSLGGFALSFYIHHTKKNEEVLTCPIGTTCDSVVHSEFSRFLGAPVEVLGMVYYAFVALGYLASILFLKVISPEFLFVLLVCSLLAFAFSLYLTYIQAFLIKNWCTWCLISAGISTLVFILSAGAGSLDIISILYQYHIFISIMHVFALALGLGGATIADFLFFRFLKDLYISEWEAGVLRSISQVVWLSLAGIILTGMGIYLPYAGDLNRSPIFLVKILALIILIINSALLNLIVTPRMVRISLGGSHKHETGELLSLRRWAFVLGAISLVSWYSMFALDILPEGISASLSVVLSIYLLVLISGVLIAGVVDKNFSNK